MSKRDKTRSSKHDKTRNKHGRRRVQQGCMTPAAPSSDKLFKSYSHKKDNKLDEAYNNLSEDFEDLKEHYNVLWKDFNELNKRINIERFVFIIVISLILYTISSIYFDCFLKVHIFIIVVITFLYLTIMVGISYLLGCFRIFKRTKSIFGDTNNLKNPFNKDKKATE